MRQSILGILAIAFVFLCSCNNKSMAGFNHPFAGTFITENGMKFELRADSTTLITFLDTTTTYEGTWKIRNAEDEYKFANIEFGGYQEYYYLKDEKLYRSEREMRHDVFGTKIEYQK